MTETAEPQLSPPVATGEIEPTPPPPDERNLAIAAHLSPLLAIVVGGWLLNLVGPLIIWLWKRDNAPFVADQAREALNFQISITIYAVVAVIIGGVVAVLTLGLGLLALVPIAIVAGIVAMILSIVAAVRASRGEQYRYPLTLRLVQ